MQNSLDENAPVKLETKSDEPGNAMIRQFWKIRYLGGGYYGIRALYKPDRCIKVTSNAAKLHVVDTFDHISYFDDNALWKIEALGTGYTLQNCGVMTSKQCLRPSGTDVVTSTFVSGNGAFTWTLTPNTIVPDLLILLDKDTARPINGSFHTLYVGETATLDDLNLMVSYVSQTKNEVDYYWQSSDSSVAYVNANDEIVVCGRGETTISLHVSSSTNTPMYFIVHSPYVDDGTYYVQNKQTGYFLSVYTDTSPDSYFITDLAFNKVATERWTIKNLGDGTFSIESADPSLDYLGVDGNSTDAGRDIVLTESCTRWYIEKTERGTFVFKPYAGGSNNLAMAVPGNADALQQHTYTSDSDLRDEWVMYDEAPDYFASITTLYDLGFLVYYRQENAQGEYLLDTYTQTVADRFMDLFGLAIHATSATYYQSCIDECKGIDGIDEIDGICQHNLVKHTDRDTLLDQILGSTVYDNTRTTVFWTGHRVMSTSPAGITNYNRSCSCDDVVLMLSRSENDDYLMQVLMHELCHQFGAEDHYCEKDADGNCINGEDRICCGDNARNQNCLMGNTTPDIYGDTVLCDDCKQDILAHLQDHHILH